MIRVHNFAVRTPPPLARRSFPVSFIPSSPPHRRKPSSPGFPASLVSLPSTQLLSSDGALVLRLRFLTRGVPFFLFLLTFFFPPSPRSRDFPFLSATPESTYLHLIFSPSVRPAQFNL